MRMWMRVYDDCSLLSEEVKCLKSRLVSLHFLWFLIPVGE